MEHERPGHRVVDDVDVGSHVIAAAEDLAGFLAVDQLAGIVLGIEPLAGSDQSLNHRQVRLRILFVPRLGDAEDLLRVVLPDVVIGRHRHADAFDDRLLIPWLPDAVTEDRSGFERGRHLRRRSDRQDHVGVDRARDVFTGVHPRVDARGGQPVTDLVVVRRHGEHHPHVEILTLLLVRLDDRLERVGRDRVLRLVDRQGFVVLLHLAPDVVGNRDAVAVVVQRVRRDDRCLGAEPDRRPDRLSGQHVGTVQLPVDDSVEQDLPVRLGLDLDVQPFVFEIALLFGDHQRGAVGQLDEAELQVALLNIQRLRFTLGGGTAVQRIGIDLDVRRGGFEIFQCNLIVAATGQQSEAGEGRNETEPPGTGGQRQTHDAGRIEGR